MWKFTDYAVICNEFRDTARGVVLGISGGPEGVIREDYGALGP